MAPTETRLHEMLERRKGGILTLSSSVQTSGAVPRQPRWGERQIMWGCCHWKRESEVCCRVLPEGEPLSAAGSASGLPYGVSGDTGNAGVGEAESEPPLVGVKVLLLIPLGSGGYAAATVWNWHRESGEGHLLTAGPG